MTLTLTPQAVKKVKTFSEKEAATVEGLRIFVEGGGCSGFQYGFIFDKQQENDNIIEQNSVKVFIDPFSAPYLEAATVDFVESLMNTGFVVQNPNSKSTCGCGMSFSV